MKSNLIFDEKTILDIQDHKKYATAMGPFGSNIKKENYVFSGIPVIRGKNILNGILDETNFVFLNKKKAEELKSSATHPGDILVVAQGNVGHIGYIPKTSKYDEFILSQNLMKITVNPKIADSLYVYYYLCSDKGQYEILKNKNQTGVPSISQPLSSLRAIQLLLPSLKKQQEISSILEKLDIQILNLKNEIRIIEKILQTLFKSKFINFDDQTKFENSEIGEIPKGWSVIKLKDALSLLKDGSHNPPKRVSSGVKFIAGASDVKHITINFSKCSYITQKDYEIMHKKWKVEPRDVLLTIVGTIGNIGIVQQSDLPFSLQRSLAVLRCNDKMDYSFLFCLLNTSEFKQFLYSNVNTTAQPGIYLGMLGSFEFVLPPKEKLNEFKKTSSLIIEQIQTNYKNILNLIKIRNLLLPKIISGQIKI